MKSTIRSAPTTVPPHKWKICVLGESDVNGPMWASSDLTDLEVAEPFMDMKIDMAAAEQGKPCSVICHIDNQHEVRRQSRDQVDRAAAQCDDERHADFGRMTSRWSST